MNFSWLKQAWSRLMAVAKPDEVESRKIGEMSFNMQHCCTFFNIATRQKVDNVSTFCQCEAS
jgi:hypothetical protein